MSLHEQSFPHDVNAAFVQIVIDSHINAPAGYLYALDSQGNVWVYSGAGWKPIPGERQGKAKTP